MIDLQNKIKLEHANNFKNKIEIVIPYNYIQIFLNEHIEKEDTIESVARKYYDKDSYMKSYNSIEDYINMICKVNNIDKYNLTPFQDIKVPVLVHKENVYLERINKCEREIDKLEYWIDYTVQDGDTLESLSYLSAGNSTEALENLEEIKKHNNLTIENIHTGDKIKIINPEIGKLKSDIVFLKHQLKQSLIMKEKEVNLN